MKISIFDVENWERDGFQSLIDEHELRLVEQSLSPETAENHRDAEMVSGFIYSKFSEELLEKLPQLKLIVVSLHVPANKKTRGMISTGEFSNMKSGAVLINTARGNVVDTQALIRGEFPSKRLAESGRQARMSLATRPWTSVRRKSRPL